MSMHADSVRGAAHGHHCGHSCQAFSTGRVRPRPHLSGHHSSGRMHGGGVCASAAAAAITVQQPATGVVLRDLPAPLQQQPPPACRRVQQAALAAANASQLLRAQLTQRQQRQQGSQQHDEPGAAASSVAPAPQRRHSRPLRSAAAAAAQVALTAQEQAAGGDAAVQPLPLGADGAAAQQQQQHQQQASGVIDPSLLPLSARMRLLSGNAAARRAASSGAGAGAGAAGKCGARRRGALPGGDVLGHCMALGLSQPAASCIVQHVLRQRVSAAPELLAAFAAAYLRLADAYGESVVLEWVRRAPPIIRAADEVPERLATLRQLLGGMSGQEVLAVTRRCPVVLGVHSSTLQERAQQLCRLLGRSFEQQGPKLVEAAPALLAMQPHTLAVKLQRLQAIAATHPAWAQAYSSLPPKSLAILLTYSLDRHARLSYAVARGMQDRLCMNTIMAWSKRRMLQLHPDFDTWCQQNKQQQQQQQQQPAGAGNSAQRQQTQKQRKQQQGQQ